MSIRRVRPCKKTCKQTPQENVNRMNGCTQLLCVIRRHLLFGVLDKVLTLNIVFAVFDLKSPKPQNIFCLEIYVFVKYY